MTRRRPVASAEFTAGDILPPRSVKAPLSDPFYAYTQNAVTVYSVVRTEVKAEQSWPKLLLPHQWRQVTHHLYKAVPIELTQGRHRLAIGVQLLCCAIVTTSQTRTVSWYAGEVVDSHDPFADAQLRRRQRLAVVWSDHASSTIVRHWSLTDGTSLLLALMPGLTGTYERVLIHAEMPL